MNAKVREERYLRDKAKEEADLIAAYKERLKKEVKLWKERNEKEMGIGYSEAMNRVLQLIHETN